jgi:glycosyltransferase involved in cell wall biosynthesis
MGEDLGRIDSAAVPTCEDPFENDERYCQAVKQFVEERGAPRLCHVYAGCFTTTVEFLKSKGVKVTYTADAHDPDRSIEEFGRCGMDFPFRHMSDRNLRAIYVKGYQLADTVVVPSTHSERVMKAFGCPSVVLIPHPVRPFPDLDLPENFAVGYMGQGGPDKGLKYLLEAWRSLDLKGARLIFAGNSADFVVPMWRRDGGKNIEIVGFVDKEEKFYRRISVYVQVSVTEGFGVPVIEAMACGRPVIVSEGAGAVDALASAPAPIGIRVPIRDPKAIAEAVRFYADNPEKIREHGRQARAHSKAYAPEVIREKYLAVWRSA